MHFVALLCSQCLFLRLTLSFQRGVPSTEVVSLQVGGEREQSEMGADLPGYAEGLGHKVSIAPLSRKVLLVQGDD